MSLLRVATLLLCLFSVTLAEESNVFLRGLLCAQCKFGETLTVSMLANILDRVATTGTDFFDQLCDQVPEGAKELCEKQSETYKRQSADLKRALDEENVCEDVLQCEESEMDAVVDVNSERLCPICKVLAEVVFERIGLKSLIEEGGDAAVAICEQLGLLGESDCATAVDQALSSVAFPTPEDVCISTGLCPKSKRPSIKRVLPVV